MKRQLITALLFISLIANAQIQFERVSPQYISDFTGYSSIDFADIDGDGDQDVMVAGECHGAYMTKLYSNDGSGNFIEVTDVSLVGVGYGAIAFADVDGDNDQDVLITGRNDNGYTAKLYVNDGVGNFIEVVGTPFFGATQGTISFADIDGDNDQDVLITGHDGTHNYYSKLYCNDGLGNFTEVASTPFIGVIQSSVAFADIDGDNDQDVLITGHTSSDEYVTKLYTNNSTGSFTEVTGTFFPGVYWGFVAFADIDGDNDQDLLITGVYNNNDDHLTKLYRNNGIGDFTEVTGTPFPNVYDSFISFADIDGDNDLDLFITGGSYTDGYDSIARLYMNDGSGHFTEASGTHFEGMGYVLFSDFDGDNDQDIFTSGHLYFNDGNENFTEALIPFKGVGSSSVALADFNGDNNLDILLSGITYDGANIKFYSNDGNGTYIEEVVSSFLPNTLNSISFADIDGDNDQDVLLITSVYGQIKLYANDGLGDFTEIPNTPFSSVSNGKATFADIDGDNDQDLLITGKDTNNDMIAKLYTNNGHGNFTEVLGTPFIGVYSSTVTFADIDGDNDQDVLITGQYRTSIGYYATRLYINDGYGNFTEVTGTPFVDVRNGSVSFADIDGDNDQDVLITGRNGNGYTAKLYANDGSGNFTEVNAPFQEVSSGAIAFADIDGDNDQDVLITGHTYNGVDVSKLYTNDGFGNFIEVVDMPFKGISYSSIAFGDVDGDNDQDVFISGHSNCFGDISFLYINRTGQANIAKTVKNNLTIYPNPTKNSFVLKTNTKIVQDIQLLNLQGQNMPFTYYKEQHKVDVNLPKGIYLLSLTIDGNKSTKKVIVE